MLFKKLKPGDTFIPGTTELLDYISLSIKLKNPLTGSHGKITAIFMSDGSGLDVPDDFNVIKVGR